jgi:hypothetical protein
MPARVYAAAASAVMRNPKLGPTDKLGGAEKFAARALELLRRGYESGEFTIKSNIAPLKVDRDFDAVRSRPDFIALLQKIEASRK